MKKYLALIVSILIASSCFAQELSFNQGGANQAGYFIKLPYEDHNNMLIVKVELGGKLRRFIFDTGAPLCLSKPLADECNISTLSKVLVNDQSGKQDSTIVASVSGLKLKDVTFDNVPALVFDNSFFIFACFNVDGLIGSNMLRNSIVQFSTADSTIIITDDKSKLNLNKKYATKLKLDKQSNPLVEVKYKGKAKGYALFDSGDNGFYTVCNEQFNKLQKDNPFQLLHDSHGSITMGMFGTADNTIIYKLLIPEMKVGNTTLSNVVSDTGNGSNSRMGTQLFKYGVVTIDYKNKKFYLDPYSQQTNAYEKYWPLNPSLRNGKMSVGIVWDGSMKNVKPGDYIIAVDGVSCENTPICDLLSKPRIPKDKEKVTLTIRNDEGEVQEVVMEKR